MQRAGTTAPRAISRRRRALAPVVLALLTAIAACSGSDGEADTTTTASSAPPPTTPIVTTTEPTSTTVATPPTDPTTTTTTSAPTTTQPPPTTGPTTTDAVGTAPPSTTAADLAAAIEADLRESSRLFIEALKNPNDEEVTFAAARYRSGDSLLEISVRLNAMAEAGQHLRPEPLVEPTLTLEAGPVPTDDGSGDYLLTICEVDSWVLVEDRDGVETVINDAIVSGRSEVRMKLIEDRWTINSATTLVVFEGPTCDPV